MPKPLHRPNPSARLAATLAACSIAHAAAASTVDLPRHPALSPDGATVVFSWRGDLWRANSGGGDATRLTSNPAAEGRSAFTPDGERIVFESDRDGLKNLWSMKADGSDLRRLTELDASFALTAVGRLGAETVVFIESTLEGDLYRSSRPFVLPVEGGTPVRLHDAFGGGASSSPDGSKVLFERGGTGVPRRGYTGPDNRNIWLYDTAAKSFQQLTSHTGYDSTARFIGPGEFLYLSDRGRSAVNVFRAQLGKDVDSVAWITDFEKDDVHGLAVSADGRTAVFCVLGDLYRIDLTKSAPTYAKIALTAAEDGQLDRELKPVGRLVSEAALSPDGKTMAVVADGDVFVRAVEEKSPTRRVTEGEARERDLCWSADGTVLYFASDRDGSDSLYAATVVETRAEARKRGKGDAPAEEKPVADAAKPADGEAKPAPTPAPEAGAEAKPEAAAEEKKPEDKPAEKKADKKDEKKDEKKDGPTPAERWADAVRFELKAVTSGADDDRRPVASPDGKSLLFTRNLGDLARVELASGEVAVLRQGWDDELEYVFSPDGSMIAFAESDQDFNKDVWILAADGSRAAVNITQHPDNDGRPRFSADGRILSFLSERTNEESDVWMVMLDRDLEGYSQRDLDQYFKDAAEAAKKRKPPEAAREKADDKKPEKPATVAAELELDDAYLRLRRVTSVPGNEDTAARRRSSARRGRSSR